MDKYELGQQIAQLLLDHSPDPRSLLDPFLFTFIELEKKLYWNTGTTPPPSHFLEMITFLDLLDTAIDKWFENGRWPYEVRSFQRFGGPRL